MGNAPDRARRNIPPLYVATKDMRLVVVRMFFKKTRRTPRREIELALRRAKEMMT